MMNVHEENKPLAWISINIIMGIIVLIINWRLLKKELSEIRSDKFTLKYLQWTSLLSISCGTVFAFFIIVQPFPIFCYISIQLQTTALINQLLFLGFYQLFRLYYCFAQSQVHLNKGYPNWLFLIMSIIGVILMINSMIFPWFYFPFIHQCGIHQHDYKSYIVYSNLISTSIANNWFILSFMCYLLWDLASLILYLLKIRSFRKYQENNAIYQRILNIMYRVLILTLFYEIVGTGIISLCNVVISPFIESDADIRNKDNIQALIASVIYSYSVFLMSEHNTEYYIKYLKSIIVKYVFCYFCCCRSRIILQIDYFEKNIQDDKVNDKSNEKDKKHHDDDTMFETHDIDQSMDRVKSGNELSVETTII